MAVSEQGEGSVLDLAQTHIPCLTVKSYLARTWQSPMGCLLVAPPNAAFFLGQVATSARVLADARLAKWREVCRMS